MTEKRFKISIGEFEEENISDTVKNIEISEISDMCTQMNTLYEENEQLKSELEHCKECLELNRESCARHMKENEQLKQPHCRKCSYFSCDNADSYCMKKEFDSIDDFNIAKL